MRLSAAAIVVSTRTHGETGAVVRVLTEEFGLVAGYVAGARGRNLRPVLIPGNRVAADLSARSDSQLPSLKLELVESRGPWLGEPLAAGAIGWVTTLAAAVLPERNAYPNIFNALAATLDAICHAPSARGWLRAVIAFERLLLRELGYGGAPPAPDADLDALLHMFARGAAPLERYLLADRRGDAMAARGMLGERLEKLKS